MAVDLKTKRSQAGQLRESWLCAVADIADIDLQRRTWLDPTSLIPHWSYIEFVSSYPDHEQLMQPQREGWLMPGEFRLLDELRAIVESYEPPRRDAYDNAAVLEDSTWHAVAAAADGARMRLLATAADKHEREALQGTNRVS
ncbi:MAG TPA: hypothetical protein VHW66_03935 [Stellaceae bacterium]|jgi:hypothetical protein|nr:hypothetical protein [Stellaceae bacterium]